MSNDYSRTRRIGLQIQRDLADLIRTEIKDPRIGMVSVNAVKVSKDLSHAKIYVTTLDDAHREEVVTVLNKAAGFLRHELAQRISIRAIPALHFFYDESIERASKISALIDEAIKSDQHPADEDDK